MSYTDENFERNVHEREDSKWDKGEEKMERERDDKAMQQAGIVSIELTSFVRKDESQTMPQGVIIRMVLGADGVLRPLNERRLGDGC